MSKLFNKFRSKKHKENDLAALNRSTYSLVSSSDLTPGSLAVWISLPDEIKYDPSLKPFQQRYDRDHESTEDQCESKQKIIENAKSYSYDEIQVFSSPQEDIETRQRQSITEDEHDQSTHKKKYCHYIKLSCLIACWLIFTIIFILYPENIPEKMYTSVGSNQIKTLKVDNKNAEKVQITLVGPFISKMDEKIIFGKKLDTSYKSLSFWLERKNETGEQISSKLKILLRNKTDFTEGISRTEIMTLPTKTMTTVDHLTIKMTTDSLEKVAFTIEYFEEPPDETNNIIFSLVLLVFLYTLIMFEIINRALAAIIVATMSLAVLSVVGLRPTMHEFMSWLDFETLLLLFSMMVLVAILTETGLFDYIAVFVFSKTKGRTWPLIISLCASTAIISTFLDNVTTVLLMSPVVIRLCEVTYLNPIPVLMAMVIYSNIGGTATPVGDPPNVIICSNPDVVEAGINFTVFAMHMFIGTLLVSIQTYLQLRFMYRKPETLRQAEPPEIQELQGQIGVWQRAASRLATVSKDEVMVRNTLERKIKKLKIQLKLKLKQNSKTPLPKESFENTLEELNEKYKIKDRTLLVYSVIAISFVVVAFFLHSIPFFQRISLGWTALLGAILLLVLADREDLEPIFNRIEWSTLLFFGALFVLMEALSKLGLIAWIGNWTEKLIMNIDQSSRLMWAILLLIWVSGVVSAFVDNIPLTTMMIRVVTSLAKNPALNLPIQPLIWALAFGVCMGGNGTLIGASANVVTAGVAEQHGYKFTFMQFFKVGFPLMIGHLVVATVYLLICHCALEWH